MIPARIRTALTMGLDCQILVIEAAARLLAARLILGIVPFPRLAAGWGNLIPPADRSALPGPATSQHRRTARRVRWAIATMAPLMPFRAACVQQAVAARGMLAHRGIDGVVHFGIGSGALAAGHAWLEADGVPVTGFPLDPALIELGRFVRCP